MYKWLWLSLLVVIVDLASKSVIIQHFFLHESMPVVSGFFNLTLVRNTGAAFSLLADQSGWQRWFFSMASAVISIVLLFWLKKLKPHETLLAVALALVLGGAWGNLSDRIALGYVVDFFHVYYQDWAWPIFNVADSAITLGAILLIYDALFLSAKNSHKDNHKES